MFLLCLVVIPTGCSLMRRILSCAAFLRISSFRSGSSRFYSKVLSPTVTLERTTSQAENEQSVAAKPSGQTETIFHKLKYRGLLSGTFPHSAFHDLHSLTALNQTVYAGFDPTADSLHVGNLLVLNALLHFYAAGFNVFAIIGGATAQLGDPTGRLTDRPFMPIDVIEKNCYALAAQIDAIFRNFTNHLFKGARTQLKPVRILNNVQWYNELNVVPFMASIGRRFRLGRMLQKEAIKSRLETDEAPTVVNGLSFAEFSYQVFQAYDWLRLCEEFGCQFQLGGADQEGNIHSGHDLVHAFLKKDAVGLFVPLIIKQETGEKLGKAAGNAVWLSAEKSSPFELYQYFVRTPDADVEKLLRIFTFCSMKEIHEVMLRNKEVPHEHLAATKLAEQTVTLVHGLEGLATAAKCTKALYGSSLESLAALSPTEVNAVFAGMPTIELQYRPDVSFLEVALQAKCFANASDAEIKIKAGGFYVNHQKILEPLGIFVAGAHILPSNISLLRTGKRNYVLIRWNTSQIL